MKPGLRDPDAPEPVWIVPGPFWAILELMGHRRLAGLVQEAQIAGAGFLRIEIPSDPPVTQFYGPSAIYAITPTTEVIATQFARRNRPEPVHSWELPRLQPENQSEEASQQGETDDDGASW